jgi:hypothetical protein
MALILLHGAAPEVQAQQGDHAGEAPSTVRPNTTAEGGRCATATRMNRNELPQMSEVAANSSSAFRLMVLTYWPTSAGEGFPSNGREDLP